MRGWSCTNKLMVTTLVWSVPMSDYHCLWYLIYFSCCLFSMWLYSLFYDSMIVEVEGRQREEHDSLANSRWISEWEGGEQNLERCRAEAGD